MKSLTLFLTRECTNRCRFCCDAVSGQVGDFMPSTEVADRCRTARKEGVTRLVLIGGEPGTHPDLEEVVRGARGCGFEIVQLITNGHALADADRARRLARAGLSGAGLSVHGATATVHDSLTRRSGAFDDVLAALRNAASSGLWITTNTVVTRQNLDQLGDIVRIVLPWTAIRAQLAIMNPAGTLRGNLADLAVAPHVAAPAICDAIRFARDQDFLCTAEALPLCLMPGLEAHAAEATLPELLVADQRCEDGRLRSFDWREDKGHVPICSGCAIAAACAGTYPSYFDMYPDLVDTLQPAVAKEMT
jgi:pyruvate-formate lyase-activating enzyme